MEKLNNNPATIPTPPRVGMALVCTFLSFGLSTQFNCYFNQNRNNEESKNKGG